MSIKINHFRDSLESIVFQEQNLKPVIKMLTTLISNKQDSEKVVEALIRARFQLLEDLIRFFSFHVGHKINLQKLDGFVEGSATFKLEQELKEKNIFLEEIAKRVEDIYEKLMKD